MNFRHIAAVALLLPAATVHATNLLSNGSFETTAGGILVNPTQGPDTNPSNGITSGQWAVFSSLLGWNTISGKGIEVRNNVPNGYLAQEGSNFVELDSHPGPGANSAMAQSFSLGASSLLDLSFYYRARPGTSGDTNGIKVYFNNAPVSLAPPGLESGPLVSTTWTKYTGQVFGAVGTNTLVFEAVGKSDTLGGSLDNVSMTVVPEPQAYGIALAGMSIVAFAMRQRRRLD
ncbi:MAG: hypothetical protein J0M00_02995 [Burkholderiales bacterium]|nr:hypothetical protein [Burkholderiales bacterium]